MLRATLLLFDQNYYLFIYYARWQPKLKYCAANCD